MDSVYEFLNESVLGDPDCLASNFGTVGESELRSALEAYYQFRVESPCAPEHYQGELSVYARVKDLSALTLVTQCALYVEHVQIDDPLFRLCFGIHRGNEQLKNLLGVNLDVDRVEVASAVQMILRIRPGVSAGYIWLHPNGRQSDALPYIESDQNFYDLLPSGLLELYRSQVHVRRVLPVDGRALIMSDNKPGRIINIHFDGHPREAFGFTLGDTQAPSPSQEDYSYWIDGCRNRAAWMLHNLVLETVHHASASGLRLLTDSSLVSQVLGENQSAVSAVVSTLADSKIPFLDALDLKTVMKIRQKDGEAFRDFRVVLENGLRGLRGIDDLEQRRRQAEEVMREIAEVNVRAVHKKFRSLFKQLALDAALRFAGITASIGVLPLFGSLLASGLAGAQFLGKLDKAETELRSMPGFFLWKSGGNQRDK